MAVAHAGDRLRENEKRITEICQGAVDGLLRTLGEVEVGLMLLEEDVLRHVAHGGTLPLIFEIPRGQGGITWRAVDSGLTQLVPDVRTDPDYLASDERIRSEVSVPLAVDGAVIGVIDVEFREPFDAAAVEAVEKTAADTAERLRPYLS